MNNAERRLHEIEERLERFGAAEPPPSLLASIQEEIPVELGAAGSQGGSAVRPLPWRRAAASLAVVAVGGLLGYQLLREGPSLEESAARSTAFESEEASSAEVAELGEVLDSSLAQVEAEPAVSQEAEGPEEDRDPFRQLNVASRSRPEFPAKVELGEGGAQGLIRPSIDRIHVGGSESEQQATFRDTSASNMSVEPELQELGFVRVEQQALDKELKALAGADPPTAVSESPLPEGVPKPDAQATGVPGRVPQPPAPEFMAGAAPQLGIAPRRREIEEGLRTLGYLNGAPSTGGTAEPNDQAYGDMFFQSYGTNPFVDTEDDAQSTFGIDVDTASYAMARSYIERGSLPPAEAIRVEEFINYFDYNDPAPRSRDFAVVAEGAPSPFASTARTYLLRFALKGREIAESQRKAAVLTFVVDVSGSMNRENRLGLVQRALRLLVNELDSGDAVGLVVYGSSGRVILEPTSNHDRVLSAIESLQPGGSTNAEEGLVLGYRTARRFFRDGAINRVILCSDGVANVGNTGPESILDRIASEAEQGIELTTVGFGMGNYNDVLMEQLADKGDGNYAYVDDLDAARRVFVDNLSGTLETIAGDAKIQVEFDKQVVQSYRLLGYENRDIADRDFRNDAVDAGEIGAGHQVTALYEVKLRPDAARRGKVATLRLRYESRRSGRVVEDAVELAQSDLAGSWGGASHGLQVAATAAEFAEVLKGSYWARDSSLTALAERARGLARSGSWDDDLAELTVLIERAARLHGTQDGEWGDGIEP